MHNKPAAKWLASHTAASASPLLFSASTTLFLFDSFYTLLIPIQTWEAELGATQAGPKDLVTWG